MSQTSFGVPISPYSNIIRLNNIFLRQMNIILNEDKRD